MRQIDLEPDAYRRLGWKEHPGIRRLLLRAAVGAGSWAAMIIFFGRHLDHGMPWWVIAGIAFAPLVMMFYIAIGLDDLS